MQTVTMENMRRIRPPIVGIAARGFTAEGEEDTLEILSVL